MITPWTLLRAPARPGRYLPLAAPAATWCSLLESRVGQHLDIATIEPPTLSSQARAGLEQSLPVFQVGETGEGAHLLQGAHATGDAAYARACELFVAEEQTHARLLALVLHALDVPLRRTHWSDRLFQWLRHLGGLRTELLTLLVAEMVALRFYSALGDGIGDPGLSCIFRRIHADEMQHIEFHAATLPPLMGSLPRPLRRIVRWCWFAMVYVSIVVVALGHRRVLRACHLSPERFVREAINLLHQHGPRFFEQADSGTGTRSLHISLAR